MAEMNINNDVLGKGVMSWTPPSSEMNHAFAQKDCVEKCNTSTGETTLMCITVTEAFV
jgi:hypothetical protein